MTLTAASVAARLARSGLDIDANHAEQLARYLELLVEWNRVHNLTGKLKPDELIDRHLVESLALAPYVNAPRVADIGSGAGLPGVPLAIVLPDVSFALIESRRKRISFLRHVATTLDLANISVIHARAESCAQGDFSTVLARAVAPPAELLQLARPLLAVDGRLIVLTSAEKEARTLSLAHDFTALAAENAPPDIRSRIVVLDRSPVS